MPIYKAGTTKGLNANVVGSLTISNGNITGFSNSSYLTIGKTFSPGSKSWEIVFQFAPNGTNPGNTVLFDASTNVSPRAITMYLSSALKMCVGLASSSASSDIKPEGAGSFTFVAGKVYIYKLSFTGSVYKGEVYDVEKGTWATDFTKNSTTPVYSSNLLMIGQWQGKTAPFYGVIDMSRSYININGSRWWSGMDYIPKKIKKICYGSRNIDKVYKGSTLVFDYVPPQPTNPTFTTLAQVGVGGDVTYKITHKGYYYFYCVNHYSDGRRWGQAYVNGTMVKQWNDWTDNRIGPYYLKPGDKIRMVTWANSWTMTIYFQEGK